MDAIALDLPGFGATAPPPEAWGSLEYAEAVATVLEDFDRPVVMVGHSFGGRVALNLALVRPDAVGGLVLTGVPLIRKVAPKGSKRYRLARRLNSMGLISDLRMEQARKRHGSSDYIAARGVMRDVLVRVVNESYEDALARIACPVELVWGDRDTAAPLAQAEVASGLLADANLTVLDGCDHETLAREPEAIRTACEGLIERIEG